MRSTPYRLTAIDTNGTLWHGVRFLSGRTALDQLTARFVEACRSEFRREGRNHSVRLMTCEPATMPEIEAHFARMVRAGVYSESEAAERVARWSRVLGVCSHAV